MIDADATLDATGLHRRLVEAAVLAPSPDNNQPWRFLSFPDRLEVHLDPARSLPSDVHSMFDLLGLGAAVENIKITASKFGYEALINYTASSDTASSAVVAVQLRPEAHPDPLVAQLGHRHTCRKMYSTRPIDSSTLNRLNSTINVTSAISTTRLHWIADRRRLAPIIAASDRIRFEYEPFHNELFHQLRFSITEVETTRDGLDVRTLELPPGAAGLFRMLRPWRRMRLVHRLGLGRLLVVPSRFAVRRSGILGLLTTENSTPENFLLAGRTFQRLWLAASAESLALQPLGSLPIFLAHVEQLDGSRLAPHHIDRIKNLRRRLDQLEPDIAGQTVLMLFRMGHAGPPSHVSLRRHVNDVFEVHHPPSSAVQETEP